MHASIGKLTTVLAQRGKGEEVKKVLAEHGFTADTTDLALGRQVYSVLRELLKGV